MSAIKLPIDILNQIDRYKRHYPWRGGDVNAKKPPLVAWKLVCKPKKKGGLGVIKLRLQNDALLMKNLDKFFSKADFPWVKLVWSQYYANGHLPGSSKKGSFWWRSILKLLDTFKGIVGAEYGIGDTILFWHDLWNNHVLKLSFPQLHSFAKSDSITLRAVMKTEDFEDLFNLPLSEIAYEQICELIIFLQGLPVSEQNDKWSYIWGNDTYTVSKAYDHLMGHEYVHPTFKWIWRSKCQMKQKMFFWMLLRNRLNTREMLRRRNMILVLIHVSYACCRECRLWHLFLSCPFAKNCWASIGVLIPSWLRATRATTYTKRHIDLPFAMEIIITMCWCI
jgi:hypothetical protein